MPAAHFAEDITWSEGSPMNDPQNRLSVLLVEDDPDYATLVQQWLDSDGNDARFVLNWTDSLSSALARLARGGIDVVLLDLSLPGSQGIETFAALSSRCPGVPVIVLTAADSEALALQTIRQGGEDYLVKSTCTRDLLIRNISHAVVRYQRQNEAHAAGDAPHDVIAVMGAKGGTGATTVACTLAAELRRQSDDSVLLADLDLDSGLMGFLMGVSSRFSILSAIENLERLDKTFWDHLVTQVGGVHVLPSAGLTAGEPVYQSHLSEAIQFAARLYRWVVLDLGRLRSANLRLLEQTSKVMMVTTDSVASLHEAKRAIEVLCAGGFDREHIQLIVNQVDEASEPQRASDLVKLFGVNVCARLPYTGALRNTPGDLKLPAESSAFSSNVRNVARSLLGLEEFKPKRAMPGLMSLLSRAKREPRPTEAEAHASRLNA
jgi:Flp pilus assembly CpaE family ATPase